MSNKVSPEVLGIRQQGGERQEAAAGPALRPAGFSRINGSISHSVIGMVHESVQSMHQMKTIAEGSAHVVAHGGVQSMQQLKTIAEGGGHVISGTLSSLPPLQNSGGALLGKLTKLPNNFFGDDNSGAQYITRAASISSLDAAIAAAPKLFKSKGLLESPNHTDPDVGGIDVVEFEAVEYICTEDDRVVDLNVIRRGPSSIQIELEFIVCEVLGSQAALARGRATLKPGERSCMVQIEVASNPNFSVERLLDVKLILFENERHAILGDLAASRIVVLNNHLFPGPVSLESQLPVIIAFIKHNYSLFPKATLCGLLFKLVPAFSFIANQYITQYTVKTITLAYIDHGHNGGEVPQSYYDSLYLLGFCYLANFLFGYYFDTLFAKLKLGGKVKNSLRAMCMDTATQLTPAGEEKFDTGRILKIVDSTVETAVEASWITCFTVFGAIVKLWFMFLFLLATISVQAEVNNAPDLMWLMATPFVFIIVDTVLFVKSFKEGARKNDEVMHAGDEWGSFVAQISFLRPVITNFRKGFTVTDMFRRIYQTYNDKAFKAAMYTKHTQYAANMLPTIIASFVMIVLGSRAMSGEITVGAFVVFMNTINAVGPTIGDIFMCFFNIGKGYASIIHVAGLLNSETRRRMMFKQQQKRAGLIEEYKAELKRSASPVDWNPNEIVLKNVTFRFKRSPVDVVPPISCRMEGAQIIALKGSGSVGKKIILRLMARQVVPTTGFVFYPARWRVRFMDAAPLFFGGDMNKLSQAKLLGEAAYTHARQTSMGTLEFNLKFGAQFQRPLDSPAIVWDREIYSLLKLLRVTPDLIGNTQEEFCLKKKYTLIGLNGEMLSQTNRALLTIARALLSSADLFLICNLLDILGPELGMHVMSVLKVLTKTRSLQELATEHDSSPPHLKKMKTVIFSTKLKELHNAADNEMFLGTLEDEQAGAGSLV